MSGCFVNFPLLPHSEASCRSQSEVLLNTDSGCGTNAKEVVKLEWLSFINRRKGRLLKKETCVDGRLGVKDLENFNMALLMQMEGGV